MTPATAAEWRTGRPERDSTGAAPEALPRRSRLCYPSAASIGAWASPAVPALKEGLIPPAATCQICNIALENHVHSPAKRLS